MSAAEKRIEELIEASSLGTPSAKAIRESVSDEDAQRIIDRVNELTKDMDDRERVTFVADLVTKHAAGGSAGYGEPTREGGKS